VSAWAPHTQTEVLDRGATLDGTEPPTTASDPRLALTPLEADMLAAINDRRSLSGLNQVQIDPALSGVARQRSADMVRRGYFSHTTPEGATFVDTLIGLGMTGTVGEILGRTNVSDQESARSVLVAFTQSPSHNLHLVYASYESIGVGSAVSQDNMKYYTVIFRAPR